MKKLTKILLAILLVSFGAYNLTLSIKKRSTYNKLNVSYSEYAEKIIKKENATRSPYRAKIDEDTLLFMYNVDSHFNSKRKSLANYSLFTALLTFLALYMLIKKNGSYLKLVLSIIIITNLWAAISLKMPMVPSLIFIGIPALMLALSYKNKKVLLK